MSQRTSAVPPPTESLGHSHHFLTITDEFSKFRKVYFLHTKDETIECIQKYINWFRNITGKDLKRFHSDEGREFRNRQVSQMLDKIGCEQTFSPPRNPSLNGAAEQNRCEPGTSGTIQCRPGTHKVPVSRMHRIRCDAIERHLDS